MSTSVRVPSSPEMSAYMQKPSFWSRITANMPQKIIALICSLILFVVVLGDRNQTVTFEQVPVEVVMPEGFVATDGRERAVDVVLQGSASDIREIRRDALGVIRIEPPPRDGNVTILLQPEMISLPEGIHVDHFAPDFLSISLEPLDTRRVPVTLDDALAGETLSGYLLGSVDVHPDWVDLTGPKSVLEQAGQVHIEPVDLTGKTASFTASRRVIAKPDGLQAHPTYVDISVGIISKASQNVIRNVPITPLNLSLTYEFVPSTIDLTLIGDEDALAKVEVSRIFVTVDAGQDDRTSHVRLLEGRDLSVSNLPPGVGFDESKIPTVLLKVWKSPEERDAEIAADANDADDEE